MGEESKMTSGTVQIKTKSRYTVTLNLRTILIILLIAGVIFAGFKWAEYQDEKQIKHDLEIRINTSDLILQNIIDTTRECKSISMTYENKSATIVALECLE